MSNRDNINTTSTTITGRGLPAVQGKLCYPHHHSHQLQHHHHPAASPARPTPTTSTTSDTTTLYTTHNTPIVGVTTRAVTRGIPYATITTTSPTAPPPLDHQPHHRMCHLQHPHHHHHQPGPTVRPGYVTGTGPSPSASPATPLPFTSPAAPLPSPTEQPPSPSASPTAPKAPSPPTPPATPWPADPPTSPSTDALPTPLSPPTHSTLTKDITDDTEQLHHLHHRLHHPHHRHHQRRNHPLHHPHHPHHQHHQRPPPHHLQGPCHLPTGHTGKTPKLPLDLARPPKDLNAAPGRTSQQAHHTTPQGSEVTGNSRASTPPPAHVTHPAVHRPATLQSHRPPASPDRTCAAAHSPWDDDYDVLPVIQHLLAATAPRPQAHQQTPEPA